MLLSGKPFIENFKWKPEKGTKFTLIKKSNGEIVRTYFSDPFFAFHHINAFEIDNNIVIDIVAYKDNSINNSLYLDQLRGNHALIIPKSEYRRYTINLLSGQINFEVIHDRLELPRINYLFNMNNYTFLYAAGMDPGINFTDRLIKINVQTRDFVTWYQKNCHPGEPVFVARPGSKDEDDGVILSVVLDSIEERSFLLILDARSFKEIDRSQVPHHIPFGIHGQYYGSVE
jgi:carotenoid cleavage dioxygenase-like enzyme